MLGGNLLAWAHAQGPFIHAQTLEPQQLPTATALCKDEKLLRSVENPRSLASSN